MKSQIVSHGPLSITIFLHGLPDPSIPFSSVTEYTPLKKFFKSRPGSIPLALGDLRHVFVSSKVVGKTVHKIIFSKNGLPFDPCPDRLFPYPPAHELTVLFLGLSPLATELSEYPAGSQTRRGLLLPRRGTVAASSPLSQVFYPMRTDRIQNDIPTHVEQVAVFLDENGFVPSLEEMAGPLVPFVKSLGVDTI